MVREPADVLAGAPLELHPDLLERVAKNRAAMLAALETADKPVYGVNTGMGRLAGVKLTVAQQAEHQHNLLVGRAVGGPPWLSAEVTRALLLMRLRSFLKPETAVSPELVTFLTDRLNDGFLPAVPRGGLGSAGEIIPLAHAFQTFAGLGFVLEDGVLTPAATALARRGVAPIRLGPKEGASLIQGAPLAQADAWVGARRADRLLDLQTQCAAIAVDALGAPHAIYRFEASARFQELIAGAEPRPGVVQAPVSVRAGPRVLGLLARTIADLRAELAHDWAALTDSPSFVDGEFVTTTGYHAAGLGFRMDALKAVLVHVAEIAVQRLHRLLDPQFSGLPAQLAADPGPQAGLVPLHKRAVGELHALRRLAAPATLGSLDTSAGQEDVQAFAWAAGAELHDALAHLTAITACELIAGAQARYLRGQGAPALESLYAWVGERVPPLETDRSLGPELTRLIEDLS
ncbi:aromatic amino acid lyase [Amycolatopsis rhabdoformis]|uniref:Aromatic amino acid lyase n=1 Tax=Amycolatopsis rhabdoformis TaxID=1448059 RepID=A0ABZ1IP06_9PSEU|nr:aromatic amino acid lyase [Amycolatopsis rhabdoformis]WSE35361.1 aromatic amino acid lyase [Amycolatopsis rhabdoformis]